MPGDIRSEEFGPYPYYYENRYDHHPDKDSTNLGCEEGWEKEKSNEQLSRVLKNMRKNYIETGPDVI